MLKRVRGEWLALKYQAVGLNLEIIQDTEGTQGVFDALKKVYESVQELQDSCVYLETISTENVIYDSAYNRVNF